jgi:hypothetical protein
MGNSGEEEMLGDSTDAGAAIYSTINAIIKLNNPWLKHACSSL